MGKRTTVKNGDRVVPVYASLNASGPAVLVFQEWWGLVPHIENIVDRFAAAGFVCAAPDLFGGARTEDPDEANRLMMAIDIEEAASNAAAVIGFLLTVPHVAGRTIATVGFCMGGALSLYVAACNKKVGACVSFYGNHPRIKPDLAALNAPVLGIFAEQDPIVTSATVSALDQQLRQHGKRYQFKIYPRVRHGFFNDEREAYDENAAADAWQLTLAFIRRELQVQ